MNLNMMVAVVIGIVAVALTAKNWIDAHRPLRDAFVLHFSVCDTRTDGTLQCQSCFAGQKEPLCPEDAQVMMMRPK